MLLRFSQTLTDVHSAASPSLWVKQTSRIQLCWILLGLTILLVSLSPAIGGDGVIRYASLHALANGEISNSKFSLLQALLSLPLYAIGKWYGNIQSVVSYFNYLVFLITFLISADFNIDRSVDLEQT